MRLGVGFLLAWGPLAVRAPGARAAAEAPSGGAPAAAARAFPWTPAPLCGEVVAAPVESGAAGPAEGAGPLCYELEASLLDGTLRGVTAWASPGASGFLDGPAALSPATAASPPKGGPVGVAYVAHPQLAEFGAWQALADLFRQQRVTTAGEREVLQEQRLAEARESLRVSAVFEPAPGVTCAVRTAGAQAQTHFLASPADVMGAAKGWEASETVRERLNLLHENATLHWRMGPEGADTGRVGYALFAFVEGESRGSERTFSLACRGPKPLFARDLSGYAFSVMPHPGGIEVRAWHDGERNVGGSPAVNPDP